MKPYLILSLLLISTLLWGQNAQKKPAAPPVTFCNPLNLSYRFCLDQPSRREAADPAMVVFRNEYYLFASKSGGYWNSTDLLHWNFITSNDLPFEDYAPAAVVMRDTLFFMASASAPVKIYKTADPKSGKWQVANGNFPIGMTDPDLFLDDNGKLYLFYGCSNVTPLYGVELDINTLNPIGSPVVCFNSNPSQFGWEVPGDYNTLVNNKPWIEGSWVTKYKGKYYYQYAIPGTEFKSYSDGVYVADNPLGPYKPALHNPVSYKPEGFVAGAGHSSTFQDNYGNYWHVVTMTISQKHNFERRLGLFPMFFDKEGTLYTYTGFGDFPMMIPQKKIAGPEELFPHWMLLSYNKPVMVSSELGNHPKSYAADEEIRTYWSAQTGDKGEWLTIDLQKTCSIYAVQVNFAENDTRLLGRSSGIYHQYVLEYSENNKTWKKLADKSTNTTDVPHDYIQLTSPVKGRYLRITNIHVPDGTFALAGLRVFGKAQGNPPVLVTNLKAERNAADKRDVKLSWTGSADAVGYTIRYGVQADKLYNTYQVLNADSLIIRSLNSAQKYYFTIDAFNESGITKGVKVVEAD